MLSVSSGVIYSLFDLFFCIKIRQCDYFLDSFVCSFMIAPYVGNVVRDDLGDFDVKKRYR